MESIGNQLEKAAFNGAVNLVPYMITLLCTLFAIAIATEWDMYFSGTWNWGNLITKIIHAGFIAFFIRNWTNIISTLKQFASKLGMIAGGADISYTPTTLLSSTLSTVYSAFSILWDKVGFNLSSILVIILTTIALAISLYAIFRIAFVLFMAQAEFIILGSLAMVLLPFGVTKWTSSISDKTWGILLTSAVKLMVAIFMVSMLGEQIQSGFSASLSGVTDASKIEVAGFLTSAFTLLFLSFLSAQAVEFAGAMTTGVMVNSNNIIHSLPGAYRDAKRVVGVGASIGRTGYRIATSKPVAWTAGKAAAAAKVAYRKAKTLTNAWWRASSF